MDVVYDKVKSFDKLTHVLIGIYVLMVLLIICTVILFIKIDKISKNYKSDVTVTDGFSSITVDDIESIANKDTMQIVYMSSKNDEICPDDCRKFEDVILKAQKKYGFQVHYLNVDSMDTDEKREKLLAFDSDDGFIKNSIGNIPMLVVLQNGHFVQAWVGTASYDEFTKFLDETGFVKK